MTKLSWDRRATSIDFKQSELSKTEGGELYDKAVQLRHKMIDDLAEMDSEMMEAVVVSGSYDSISADAIRRSLHNVTCSNSAVPVLMGSSLKNCAIQPLLDAIVDYLPSPERNNQQFTLDDQLCAFAFKTVHQKERGAVTFLRLYNGAITGSLKVFNATQEHSDKIGKIYTILADQMLETKIAQAGKPLILHSIKCYWPIDYYLTA